MKKLSTNKGTALVVLAFSMVMLVAIGGLAVDVGNVFQTKATAQRAADAAAIGYFIPIV